MSRFGSNGNSNPDLTRVSITGIDGAGKDSVAHQSIELLTQASDLTAVKIGRPAFVSSHGQMRPINSRFTGFFDRLHEFADNRQSADLVLAVNAVSVAAQARYLERVVSKSLKIRPDLIFSDRDPRVDSAVYYSYYRMRGVKEVPMKKRVETVQRITGIGRDLLILLRVEPRTAVQRIHGRIESESAAQSGVGEGSPDGREKWMHMHENETDLAVLASKYNDAIEILRGIQPTPVVDIDTNGLSQVEVATIARDYIRLAIDGELSPDDWHEVAANGLVDFADGQPAETANHDILA